jgi:tetratricopeptide (TPR) repeat protein
MKRSLTILALLLFGTMAFAAESESDVPMVIRNNSYYTESLRLNNQARLAYDEGDYDASIKYSEEAIRYTNLSDEYIKMRLKMWEADRVIFAAGKRLDYISSMNLDSEFPDEYMQAQNYYSEARSLRAEEKWDEAIEAAYMVLQILALIDGVFPSEFVFLPSQYIVRTWGSVKDCLWNIAGRPWVYNDPYKWKVLYDANKAKMPESENPDLIVPGMILDIPSIRGEKRQGTWDSNKDYSPLR